MYNGKHCIRDSNHKNCYVINYVYLHRAEPLYQAVIAVPLIICLAIKKYCSKVYQLLYRIRFQNNCCFIGQTCDVTIKYRASIKGVSWLCSQRALQLIDYAFLDADVEVASMRVALPSSM